MRYALIENNTVINMIEADGVLQGLNMVPTDTADLGWLWNGETFSEPTPAPVVITVPTEITMRQARLALLGAGLLSTVSATIEAMDEPQKSAANIEWEYSNTVLRHNGFVSVLGPMLGLTEEQIDDLFILAATL